MVGVRQEVVMVGVGLLHGHPMNANRMSAGVKGKLRRHLERSGRYEPLVVRRHPERAGEYQLINGHHRAEVLRELGHEEAACVVWELSDEETLLLLATVNRLGGEDVAGKRVALLAELARGMGGMEGVAGVKGLSELLPEEEGVLGKLLAEVKGVELKGATAGVEGMMEALTVFLPAGEKREVVRKLRETDRDMGRAILEWARGREKRGGVK